MNTHLLCFSRRSLGLCFCFLLPFFSFGAISLILPLANAQVAQQSREPGVPLRLPRQQAKTISALSGVVRSGGASTAQTPVAGASLQLQNPATGVTTTSSANGEGVFRMFPLPAGDYSLHVQADGHAPLAL